MHLLISTNAAFVNFPLKYPKGRGNTQKFIMKANKENLVGMVTNCEAAGVAREKLTKALPQESQLTSPETLRSISPLSALLKLRDSSESPDSHLAITRMLQHSAWYMVLGTWYSNHISAK